MASRKSQQNSAASVLDGYEPLEVIGSGTFGLIRKVRRISDGKLFARKELQFDRMTDRDRKQIVAEVNILRGLQHENIVKYEERFIDRENQILYIVMEYCEGGDLGSTIKKCRKTNTLLPEEMVWSYVSQMVLGLDACHYRGSSPSSSGSASPTEDMAIPASAVLHRDLKPENVFLDGNQNIKIGDFGLSKEVAAQSFACTYVGTPYYMSPELAVGSPYDIKADIWALGCVAFELCALAPPFDAQDQAELTRKIKLGHIPELPRGYSSDLGNLIRSMMDLNPKRRPTTKHLLREHPIRLACRTIELATMSRKIAMEKNKLRAQYYELEMRERAISAREQEVISIKASNNHQRDQEEKFEQRERLLQARERAVTEREHQLEEQIQKRNREGWEEEKIKVRSRQSESEVGNRERSSSSHAVAANSGIRRPVAARRVSSGTVARYSSSGVEGAMSSAITPRSHKAEAARQRFTKAGMIPSRSTIEKPFRKRTNSEGSEDWVDNEGETESEGKSRPSSSQGEDRRDSIAAVARSRRYSSNTNSIRPEVIAHPEASDEVAERYTTTSRSRSTRKSITTLPPSARAWVNEIVKGCISTDLGEDVSMRDASAFWNGTDDKENYQRLDLEGEGEGEGGLEKGQSMPSMGGDDVKPSNRPALIARTTIATECAVLECLAPAAVYDLSHDEDLPSPFLRKVTRQNNEMLSKRGLKSGTGSNLVGPTNFLARAAAAGAARQSMAAVKELETTAPVSSSTTTTTKHTAAPFTTNTTTITKPPARRMSSVAAAPATRVAMPTSASLSDIKSSNIAPALLVTKTRSSALPGSIGVAPIKGARKSNIAPAIPTVRQRAA